MLIDIIITISLILCIILPGVLTTSIIISITAFVLLLLPPVRRVPLFFYILITISPFSILGETPGYATTLGKISIGNVLLFIALLCKLLRYPFEEFRYKNQNKPLMKLTIILWFIFLIAAISGFFLNTNYDFYLKELNNWSYFIILFPLFYMDFRMIEKHMLDDIFISIIKYCFMANVILFSFGIFGILTGKNIYLGWLDPIAAGRIFPPTWRTWRISYGAMIFANIFGIYGFINILLRRTPYLQKQRSQSKIKTRENHRLIFIVYLLIACIIIGLSQTRASIIGFLISILSSMIYLVEKKINLVRSATIIFILLMIATILINLTINIPKTSSNENFTIKDLFNIERINEDTYRLEEARGLIKSIIEDNFIGAGAGAAYTFYNPLFKISSYEHWLPHITPLYILYKLGIIGFIVFYTLWFKIILLAWRGRRKPFIIKEEEPNIGLTIISSCTIFSFCISIIAQSLLGPANVSIHGFIIFSLLICFLAFDEYRHNSCI
ncbi:MAG: O-antigen ligase family protein [Actinobacteria bacterium]|nr:O-antigen ligase family protein [Actinomycetota bacterium]